MPILIDRIRATRCRSTKNGGTTSGIGDHHAITKQLGDELYVGSFTTAGTGPGELKERLPELASLNRGGRNHIVHDREFSREFMIRNLYFYLRGQWPHHQGILLGRTDISTVPAARAIKRADLNPEPQSLQFFPLGLQGHKIFWGIIEVPFMCQNRTNDGMGTNKGALITLYTVFRNPFWHVEGNTSFFIPGRRCGEYTVRAEGTHRELVPLLSQHGPHDLLHELRLIRFKICLMAGCGPRFWDLDFFQGTQCLVHGINVHLYNLLTLFSVSLFDSLLYVLECLLGRNHLGDLKKRRLHDHVYASAQTHFRSNFDGINIVEV